MSGRLTSEICRTLSDMRGMKMLLRVGLGRNDTKEKVDLLAGCDGGEVESNFSSIIASLEDRWPNGKFFAFDDSVRFDLPKSSGGVAICDPSQLIQRVERWIRGEKLDGQHRPWAIGYWLPEAFCGDLATSKILYDATGVGIQLKKILTPYPPALAGYICEYCVREVKHKLTVLNKLQADAITERSICLADIAATITRLAYARSQKYFRGFQSLREQAKHLNPSDVVLYELAKELLRNKGTKSTISKIKKIF